MKKKNLFAISNKKIIAFLCAAVMLASCLCTLSGCGKKKKENVPLQITEIVASNRYCLSAEDGSSPDWIEIYNPTDRDADLEGYGLSDDSENPYKFRFPEGAVLKAGEYMVVYCTGTEDLAPADGIYRAGFKISSQGEILCFYARNDKLLQLIDLPALETDISVGFDENGAAAYYASPTPAAENSGESNDTGIFEKDDVTAAATLVINEFMPENKYSLRAEDGNHYSWVELKNTGSEPVNLSAYGLSDDYENPNKWSFPDMELGAGELMLVYLSGLGTKTDTELHAGVSLSTEDNSLVLCDTAANIIDYVTPMDTDGRVSIGLYGENLVYFAQSTPGTENTSEPYTDLAAAMAYLPALHISEVKSSSEDDIDWIEMHNAGEEIVDLSGFGLSDSRDEAYRYTFAAGDSIGPGEYLTVSFEKGSAISIAKSGEMLYLTDPDGITVDYMNGGTQNIEISRGRKAGGDNTVYYFKTATKGAENSSEVFSTYASAPQFSQTGGIVTAGTQITITAAEGDQIYYTTDGSEPTTSDTRYTAPITISENTPLRARSFADGKLASTVTTENYLVGVEHDIAMVCISMDPDDFLGHSNGIYAKGPNYDVDDGQDYVHTHANYWQDWEREMNFEWFEEDGTKGIDFDAGIKIFGQYSKELDQKSLSVKIRGEYGQSTVTYPFFRDHEYTSFSNLILRQSGQDWNKTKILDAMIGQVCKDTNVEVMEYRPCAVYINGEYWGLYNLREKQDEDFVLTRYPEAEEGKVDVLKGDFRYPNAGDSKEWRALIDYVNAHDMSQLEPQLYAEERVNMVSLYDWIGIQAFIANTDTGNKRRFKYDGGKWNWMLFDTDWALQATGSNSVNRLSALVKERGHGSGNNFNNSMMRAIATNPNWSKAFVERYAELLNTTLRPERFHAIIDAMAAEIRTEMPNQVDRWGAPASVEKWEENIENLKKTVDSRWPAAVKELKSTFGLSDARMAELFPNGTE